VSAAPAATSFSASEMMIVAAARELAGQHVCFVGVGLPNICVNLAKRTVAPDLELVYEAGVFGARPARLPLSIGDPTIVTHATGHSMFELRYYPQRPDRRRLWRGPRSLPTWQPLSRVRHTRHASAGRQRADRQTPIDLRPSCHTELFVEQTRHLGGARVRVVVTDLASTIC
jgi:hypothetical protein